MVRNLDDDELATHIVSRLEQNRTVNREMTIISESGLYNAIFKSRRKEAKIFRRWVTGTVLPEIRRTGAFAMIAPDHGPRGETAILADVDTTRMALALNAVSLMRKLRGNACALDLWRTVGLPWPRGVVDDSDDDDGLTSRIDAWLGQGFQNRFTTEQLAGAIYLPELSAPIRRRIADILTAFGYEKRRARVAGGALAYCWFIHNDLEQSLNDSDVSGNSEAAND